MLVKILFLIISIKCLVECKDHNYTNDRTLAVPIREKVSLQKQIHLSIGDDLSEMVIIWNQKHPTNKTAVNYGFFNGDFNHMETGYSQELKNGNKIQFIHSVKLKNLKPNVRYKYRVGSPQSWSEEHNFKTLRTDTKWVPRLAIFGDLGWIKGYSIPNLIKMTDKGAFDMVVHIGDIAYELYTMEGTLGDGFMNAIEPIASKIPYMVLPGNHEYYCSRDHDYGYNYKRRFQMPQNTDNEFYSFKLGKALFVAFSTEHYFTKENGSNDKVLQQKQWLEQVLTEANQPHNRAKWPWIIGLGHRSLYCSTKDPDCIDGMTIDIGDTDTSMIELEEILQRHGVDVTFWGHYHYYDRFYPVYNRTMCKSDNPYVNPKFNIHILSGSAGMDGEEEVLMDPPPPFSAFRTVAFGYTIMNVVNQTHLYMRQIDVNNTKTAIDSFWVIQHNHGSRDIQSLLSSPSCNS